MQLETLSPNEHGDWISQRHDVFETFVRVDSEKKFDVKSHSFFVVNSRGNETSRDAWVYNFSKGLVEATMKSMVEFYNLQVDSYSVAKQKTPSLNVNECIETNPEKISWSSSLISNLERCVKAGFEPDYIVSGLYRPFYKQHLYLGDKMIHRRGQMVEFFPKPSTKNLLICVSGVGGTKDFTAILTNAIPDVQLQFNGQCFPLYYYEERQKQGRGLFDTDESGSEHLRRDGVSDFILERGKKQYGKNVTKEDIFYYVYGSLHSPEYRKTFANDLKKMLPRLPLVDEPKMFWAFSKAGRKLAELHINYETVPAYKGVKVTGADSGFYTVEKMRFPKKDQRDTIHYNSKITISNIPAKAYEYVVNGKSAIEWIMERYKVTVHKDSGIKNDPNDWAKEVGNPKYILDLLLSIINVSVQTMMIVDGLPKTTFC